MSPLQQKKIRLLAKIKSMATIMQTSNFRVLENAYNIWHVRSWIINLDSVVPVNNAQVKKKSPLPPTSECRWWLVLKCEQTRQMTHYMGRYMGTNSPPHEDILKHVCILDYREFITTTMVVILDFKQRFLPNTPSCLVEVPKCAKNSYKISAHSKMPQRRKSINK